MLSFASALSKSDSPIGKNMLIEGIETSLLTPSIWVLLPLGK